MFTVPIISRRKIHILLLKECVWVLLLAAQEPINKPGWWKEKFVFLQMPATGWGDGVGHLSTPTRTGSQWVRAFMDRSVWGGGGGGEATFRNSTVSSDSLLQIDHQWSDQCQLGCFRYSYSSVPASLIAQLVNNLPAM